MKKVLFLFLVLIFCYQASFAKEEILSQYEFNKNNIKVLYDNNELRFYQIHENGVKMLLTQEEVQKLFPDYQIVTISDFDKNKKLKMKNSLFGSKKVLILNDRNRTFHGFEVYPISSRNELVELEGLQNKAVIKSLITVYGKKDVRIKHSGGDEFEIIVK